MTDAPEIRRMVTREMIEAHYKSVMATALTLLSQDCVALAQNLLSEAFRLPYPIPAPAAIPEARCVDATLPDHLLIAAAPDLYEALYRLMQNLPPNDDEDGLYGLYEAAKDRARAALAKARGGTK